MRPIFIALILLLMFGCKRQQEQIEKFLFDYSQINSKEIHQYVFDDHGKIKIDKNIFYTYRGGKVIDSIAFTKKYFYNAKGKLERIMGLENGEHELKIYNDQDSLIGEFKVNRENDTTFFERTVYGNGKKIMLTTRWLMEKLPDFEDPQKGDFKNFDTVFIKKQFLYQNGLISKTLVTDQYGHLKEEIHHLYKNGIESKTETYAFLRKLKYLKETKTYNLEDNKKSDYIAIGNEGDTLTVRKTVRQDDLNVIIKHYKSAGIQILEYYNDKNQLIGTVDFDRREKIKNMASISYDNKGNIIEEARYRQRLN